MSDRGAVIAGSATLAAGLVTLAHLPSIEPLWVAAGLALCGLGFGVLVQALNGRALPPGSHVRAATLTSTARHLGLVVGLAIIAPVLAGQVTVAAEIAPIPATKAMLDAPIDGPTKIRIALDMRDLLERASDGEVPDLDAVFQRNGAVGDPAVARLGDDVERGVQEVLTRSFRDSFTIAAAFALLAGVVGLLAVSMGPNRAAPVRRVRRRYGAAIAVSTVVAAMILPVGAVRASDDDFGSAGVLDPCTAPPDTFPGDGFDAAAQRFLFSGLNGAACELGISREELVLSLEPRAGIDVEWDRDTIIQAVKDGFDRAVHDAADRGTLPDWVASALAWTVDHAPVSWFLDRLGVT
jgi:hypothetical protein